MKPRLATSKKWTPFPDEFVEKVRNVFSQNFQDAAEHGDFLIEGRIYPEEITLRVGYLEKGRLRQVNFEASMDYSQEKHNAMEKIYACIDATAEMMNQYFEAEKEEEQVEFPLNWQDFSIEGGTIYLQYSTVNTRLEEEADKLLGLTEKKLVYEEEEP